MNEYLKKAEDFLTAHDAKIKIVFDHCGKYWEDDKENRNIYNVTITRDDKSYTTQFGDSLHNTEEANKIKARAKMEARNLTGAEWRKIKNKYTPNAYDILACLQKYETPSDPWEFANEFGYEINSHADFRKVDRICEACEKEYKAIYNMFSDCMDELAEIN